MPDSQVTRRYLEQCRTNHALRDARSHAVTGPAFAEAYGSMPLPRPLFVDEATVRAAANDVRAIFDLIVSLPDRLFDGDRRRHAITVGFDERYAGLALRAGGGEPDTYGRADLIHDGTAFRLVEVNVGSELGGIELSEASRALLEVAAFREFAEDHQLSYVDTIGEVVALLRRVAEPVTGGRDPVVALLEWTDGFQELSVLQRSIKEAIAARGIEIHLAEVQQVVNRDGKLYLHDRPIDIVLRYLDHTQAGPDPRAEELLDPVMRAHEAGGTVFFTRLESNIFTSKMNLALLSDASNRDSFDATEAALIDRVLPWTRVLTDGPTHVDGETVDLLSYCRVHREAMVVKPAARHGGRGTVVGRDVSDGEWERALADRLADPHVVQRAVAAQIEQMVNPQTGEVEDWLPVWGVFFTDQGYAGEWIRARRAGSGSVVSYGTSDGISSAFHHPAHDVQPPSVA